MYSSNYSRAKFGLEAREPLHRSRGKSCGYYMRIIFFFSSLIQSLIIVSLVLFLIYGQPEKSAEEKRVKDLERSFNILSDKNIELKKEKADIRTQLGARMAEKAALEKDLEKEKIKANKTETALNLKLTQCEGFKKIALARSAAVAPCSSSAQPASVAINSGSEIKTLQSLNEQQNAMIHLINANFTRMVQDLSQQRNDALKDRNGHHQDAITLRKENTILKQQLTTYTKKCKEDFAQSLDGIKTVTSAFLSKINNLFPHQMTFHLTCDSQQEQMEKIRNSCTNLSRDVENKFQIYLDNVGNKVADIQSLSSRLEVNNSHLTSDLEQCKNSHDQKMAEASRKLEQRQQTHDSQMEMYLKEQNQLREEKKVQADRLAGQDTELQALKRMIQTLTAQPNCKLGVPSGQQVAPQTANKQSGSIRTSGITQG
ncbi:plasmalemma vesicle associated protein b isoform X2 [Thalassophryne amazonica]|nr:plasmalemma vesicle associated protein b isoform X2 [Thalassophryne amazonica]